MRRIEFIWSSEENLEQLSGHVNEFISENELNVIDIRHTAIVNKNGEVEDTVMIIYEDGNV